MNQTVGARFPDLAFKDQWGQEVKFSDITESRFPLVVVFYRGYW